MKRCHPRPPQAFHCHCNVMEQDCRVIKRWSVGNWNSSWQILRMYRVVAKVGRKSCRWDKLEYVVFIVDIYHGLAGDMQPYTFHLHSKASTKPLKTWQPITFADRATVFLWLSKQNSGAFGREPCPAIPGMENFIGQRHAVLLVWSKPPKMDSSSNEAVAIRNKHQGRMWLYLSRHQNRDKVINNVANEGCGLRLQHTGTPHRKQKKEWMWYRELTQYKWG